jgi:hypothetical protein
MLAALVEIHRRAVWSDVGTVDDTLFSTAVIFEGNIVQ